MALQHDELIKRLERLLTALIASSCWDEAEALSIALDILRKGENKDENISDR